MSDRAPSNPTNTLPPSSPREVASPCISVCQMNDDTGWCVGCLRTLDEIGQWSHMSNAQKSDLWVTLGRRRVLWRARSNTPAGNTP